MTKVRALTARGVDKFGDLLSSIRTTGSLSPPQVSEFDYSPWSEETQLDLLEHPNFRTRFELGEYLAREFEAAKGDRRWLVQMKGLWSWLALVWFDAICPVVEGKRRLREDARYICSSDWRDYYRHLVATSWLLYDAHREKARLFLDSPLHINNDFIEHVADNQNLISNGSLVEVIDLLYWDAVMNKARPYATNRFVRGNIRRLVAVARQLGLTYDLQSMAPRQIVGLLGDEFDQWQGTRRGGHR